MVRYFMQMTIKRITEDAGGNGQALVGIALEE